MRKNIVAGNWKMNKTLSEGISLVKDVNTAVQAIDTDCLVIIAPPFIHLTSVAEVIDKDRIALAAQNCATQPEGAYTGEVSAAMIASTGATYVIIGHSERRAYYHEDAEVLTDKVNQALAADLTPIFCVGEQLSEREADRQYEVVEAQISSSLFHLSEGDFARIILAYEPVWAIGTGRTATSDQAQEMHAHIRAFVAGRYGSIIADDCSILYGGSCNASNAAELFAKPDVDGGLIGGASLSADKFVPIIQAR